MRTTVSVVCTLALALCAASAWAQSTPPADSLKVDYFANANTAAAPDATVRLTNPGTAGANICASIYVFDVNEEMSECCSCFLSPDGLRTLSVNTDLTSNPLTGVVLTTGVIKMVSSKVVAGACPLPTKITAIATLRAWTTHIQDVSYVETEGNSQDATLSSGELTSLQTECHAIGLDGSGKGVCSCGTGD
jgi:hypothetical protein